MKIPESFLTSVIGELAQLVRASALHAEGQGFDSLILHKESSEEGSFFLIIVQVSWSEHPDSSVEGQGFIPYLRFRKEFFTPLFS